MFCPYIKEECKEGCIMLLDGNKCLDREYKLFSIERGKQLSDNLTRMQNMTRVVYDIIFDDIENSDAPEQVKDYIRKYRDSEQADTLLRELGINKEE